MSATDAKMHDEKIETRKSSGGMEAGFAVGDEKATSRVLFKMDVRYVWNFPAHGPEVDAIQYSAYTRLTVPLFLHRQDERRQCEDLGA